MEPINKNFPKRINDLPEEVLVNIFERLDTSDLIDKASLVCKQWNQTISTSSRLMNKVQFYFKPNRHSSIELDSLLDSLKNVRNYKNVKLLFWTQCSYRLSENDTARLFNNMCKSLENSLTTLKLEGLHGLTNFQVIARCKFIISLIISRCCCPTFDNDERDFLKRFSSGENQLQPSEFTNLRYLEVINSPFILNFIGCKQLNRFRLVQWSKSHRLFSNYDHIHAIYDFESIRFWKFVDQLERCDELDLTIRSSSWEETIPNLKFKWNRLDLTLESEACGSFSQEGLRRIGFLYRESSPNAEAEINLKALKGSLEEFVRLTLNLTRIESLNLDGYIFGWSITSEITDLSQNSEQIKKLGICTELLKDQIFANFALKLPNVTQLKLLSNCRRERPSAETLLTLQPFFDKITELELPYSFIGPDHSKDVNYIKEIQFNNLHSITIVFRFLFTLVQEN